MVTQEKILFVMAASVLGIAGIRALLVAINVVFPFAVWASIGFFAVSGAPKFAEWLTRVGTVGASATWSAVEGRMRALGNETAYKDAVSTMTSRQRKLICSGAIPDHYESLDDLQAALRLCGLESSNLIFAVDFTASNTRSGSNTYDNPDLHHVYPGGNRLNPYQRALAAIYRVLNQYDEDGCIPLLGFGDIHTKDRAVFDMYAKVGSTGGRGRSRRSKKTEETSLDRTMEAYASTVANVKMSGPTSFEPLIDEAIKICEDTGDYHIMVILTDGHPSDFRRDAAAVCRASNYPLSIVAIGLGDGPFDMMDAFDDSLTNRRFDNFQFVDCNNILSISDQKVADEQLAIDALQEIPSQFATICDLGML